MFGIGISEQFQLELMNTLYRQHGFTEEQWMLRVDTTLKKLRQDNPKYTDRDIERLRKKQLQDWRNFIALVDK